jgi:putative transposase
MEVPMGMRRPKAPLVLDAEQRGQLEGFANSRSLPARLVRRAKIILLSASGTTNREVARQLETSKVTVSLISRAWHARTLRRDTAGPPTTDQRRARSAHRIWQAFGLQPHRQKQFKLSGDPFFVEKARDIVGLYLNPPENAVVLCVDEKSGIQALERTQPMLPLGLGYVEGMTHDYRRHGTFTLFAALDTANGKVLRQCRPRHRHQEYLGFLREIKKNVPKNLDVHVIVDNYATHKHLRVRRWFATRPRFHVQLSPSSPSPTLCLSDKRTETTCPV